MNIHDLQMEENRLNSRYSHILEEYKSNVKLKDNDTILHFKDFDLYFKNIENLENFLHYQCEIRFNQIKHLLFNQK